ncbi:MAG: class I adenylate-forming enzyme family protein [Alphaproteobacteria bacterium]
MTSRTWFGAGIARFAQAMPQASAIVTPDGVIDRATLQRRIEERAAALLGRGIVPGVTVALFMRDQVEDLISYLALARLGAPILCLDPGEPQLNRALTERAGARFLIGAAADAMAGGWEFLDAVTLGAGDASALPPPPEPSAVGFLSRSSGTTSGVPKLTRVTHAHHLGRADAFNRRFARTPDERYVAILSVAFELGRSVFTRALEEGGSAILPPPLKSVDALAATARELGATWTALTPAHLRSLVAAAPAGGQLLPWMRILCSAAALTAAERRQVMERISPRLSILYGTNEIGALAIARPEDLSRRIDTVGRVLDGITAEAVDGDTPLPAGRIGELRFSSPEFPSSYVDAVPGSGGRFVGGWYYPGDIGAIDADGFLFLRGRTDDMINAGGRKIYPADIEDCLTQHPAVAEAFAFGLPERHEGTAAVAAIVLRAPCPLVEIRAHCISVLGQGRTPRILRAFPALPRTPLGKIDRAAMLAAWTAGG